MPKKRNTKRQDGRIAVQVYLGRVDGKRRYKTVYGRTQKEADEKALQVKLAMKKGIDVTAENDTFGQWAERWIKLKKCSPGRLKICRYSIEKLAPISEIPISKIKPSQIQEIIQQYANFNPTTGKPSARKTLLDLRNAAHQIFDLAIKNRIIDWNPVNAVEIPSDAPQERREALPIEWVLLIESTQHKAQLAAMIMLYAGLRRGELLALEWNQVDLVNGCIHITQSVEMYSGKPHIKEGGKTQYARRTVYIPDKLINYLRPLAQTHIAPLHGPDLVFPAAHGGPMGNASWERLWKSYMKALSEAAGKPVWFTAHQLRHTFATSLYLAGIDVKTAQDQLGHADVETTMDIYTHLDRQYKRRSMDKLNTFYASQMQVRTFNKHSGSAG